jgi:hypothetical protein
MPNTMLGLQGGRATGSEQTFDDQPMQAGVHLRWSFATELGFPPGGFRLCRRVAHARGEKIPLPLHLQAALAARDIVMKAGVVADEWRAELRPPGDELILLGEASSSRARLCIQTFCRDHAGCYFDCGEQTVDIAGRRFRATILGQQIAHLRVAGASSLEILRL